MEPKRVAIVTGCSSGIGAAIALQLLSEGFRVYATARRPESIQDLKASGCDLLALDVTKKESLQAVFEQVKSEAGRLDLLVNNAGVGSLPCPTLDLDVDKARQMFETNVWGVVHACQILAPLLIETATPKSPTCILNIGSIAGPNAFPFRAAYSASKAALHAVNDSLRQELKPLNVNVVLSVTGGVHTNIVTKALSVRKENADSVFATIPDLLDRLLKSRQGLDKHSWSPARLAAYLIPRAIVANPTAHIHTASWKFAYRWLVPIAPTWLLDYVFAKKMGVVLLQEYFARPKTS